MYKFIFFLLLVPVAAWPAKADYDTIALVYRKVHEENPQHLSYARMTEEALKGLQKMDDKLKFGTSDRTDYRLLWRQDGQEFS